MAQLDDCHADSPSDSQPFQFFFPNRSKQVSLIYSTLPPNQVLLTLLAPDHIILPFFISLASGLPGLGYTFPKICKPSAWPRHTLSCSCQPTPVMGLTPQRCRGISLDAWVRILSQAMWLSAHARKSYNPQCSPVQKVPDGTSKQHLPEHGQTKYPGQVVQSCIFIPNGTIKQALFK